MPSIISPRTYEKLKKVFKDEEALISFLEDLNKEFEKFESISKEYKENIENNLYSRLVQKLPTKEELKSEINRLENEIKHLENKIGNLKEFTQKLVTKEEFKSEFNRLENKIESESKRLEAELKRLENKIDIEIKRLENKIEAETKHLEDKIENLKQTIDIKFKIVIGLIILGFTIFNPNFITILKMFLSLFN